MQELEQHIHKVVQETMASGIVEAQIKELTEKAVIEAFNGLFRSYGKINKQIEKGLEDAINIDFGQVEIPEYNLMIMQIVESVTLKHLKEQASTTLVKNLEQMLSPAPKEITVQELLNHFLEEWREDPYDCDDRVTVEISKGSTDWYDLKIWKKKKPSYSGGGDRSPDISLYVSDEGVIRIIRGEDFRANFGTTNYNGMAKVYLMYAAGTKITDIATCNTDYLERHVREYD